MGLPDRHLAIDANGSQPLSSPGGSASIAHFRRTSGKGSESYSLRSPRSEERCALSPVNKKVPVKGVPSLVLCLARRLGQARSSSSHRGDGGCFDQDAHYQNQKRW